MRSEVAYILSGLFSQYRPGIQESNWAGGLLHLVPAFLLSGTCQQKTDLIEMKQKRRSGDMSGNLWYFVGGIVLLCILVLGQSLSLGNLILIGVPLLTLIGFAVRILLMRKDHNKKKDSE